MSNHREPESTYMAMVHGQLVQVKRYPKVNSPTPKVMPRDRALLQKIDETWKEYETEVPSADSERGVDTDYSKIRSLPPIDDRIDWDKL